MVFSKVDIDDLTVRNSFLQESHLGACCIGYIGSLQYSMH